MAPNGVVHDFFFRQIAMGCFLSKLILNRLEVGRLFHGQITHVRLYNRDKTRRPKVDMYCTLHRPSTPLLANHRTANKSDELISQILAF